MSGQDPLRAGEAATFWLQGFVCLQSFLSAPDVYAALAESERLIASALTLDHSTLQFNLEAPGGGFSSQDGSAEAFRGVVRKVNGLEQLSGFFAELSARPAVLEAAGQIIGKPVEIYNTILWCKQPRLGSAKPLHQDAPYFAPPFDDFLTLWVALDAATKSNGCLEFVPGSHRSGLLPFNGEEMLVDAAPYASHLRACVLAPGDAVAFHACTLHSSAANLSSRPRRALMLRYCARRAFP